VNYFSRASFNDDFILIGAVKNDLRGDSSGLALKEAKTVSRAFRKEASRAWKDGGNSLKAPGRERSAPLATARPRPWPVAAARPGCMPTNATSRSAASSTWCALAISWTLGEDGAEEKAWD